MGRNEVGWVVVWWIGCVEKRGRGIGEVVVVGGMCRSLSWNMEGCCGV